jgi:hypothetical protein
MLEETSTPATIWIVTEETLESTTESGARTSEDTGGVIKLEETTEIKEVSVTRRKEVKVTKLKQEMRSFLQAMQETLDEADKSDSRMRLDEVELSVEINGEGQVSLFGVGGGKAGAKGAMTLKFKRRNG